MMKNLHNIDRGVRIAIAVVLAVVLFTGTVSINSVLGIILAVIAAVMLITGLVGFCLLYRLFGINTCPRQIKK